MTSLLLASWLAAAQAPAAIPEPGSTTDVRCAEKPRISYALSLPPQYDPQKRWPILYVFDPRGRARLALDLFRPAADAHGWLVASSYDTRSDEDPAPSLEAIEAVWADTRARLPLAPRRSYAAGFSGAARLACQLGAAAHGELAGVIAAGGSFPDPTAPPADTRFAVFGTVGITDFNYYEMRLLSGLLASRGVPYHLEEFDGGHAWPPAPLLAEAITWMELVAMRRGLRPPDAALVASFAARGQEQARAREARGDVVGALEAWEALAQDLDGLSDVAEARREAARLRGGALPEQRRRARLDERDRTQLVRTRKLLAGLQPPSGPPSLAALVRELEIEDLRRQAAASPSTYDSLSAQRRLEDVHVLTAGYLAPGLAKQGEFARAALALSVALAVRPEASVDRYNLACAWARAGRPQDALRELQRAVDAGFRDVAHIEGDEDLATLRPTPGFRELLARLRTASP